MTPGADVWAPWLDDGFLYPAVVVASKGAKTQVAYWDGDIAMVETRGLRPFELRVGDRVSVNWRNQGGYWDGAVTARHGGAIQVEYEDDGSIEWTTWAKCRIAIA